MSNTLVNQLHLMVLSVIDSIELCSSFKIISENTGLPREIVAGVLRDLRLKGFAEYQKGLWSEAKDYPAGSGYCATSEGLLHLDKLRQVSQL
jgi:hypothetical protein